MKFTIPRTLAAFMFCFGLSLFGQTPSGEEAFLMGPEEFSKRIREELKRADDPNTPWNRMSDEEREIQRELYRLMQEKTDRRSELLNAHVNLPREERIRNQKSFHQEIKDLNAYYKAEEARIRASFPSTDALPPQPDREIDRWEFLALIVIDGKEEFSLNNPWEKKAFQAEINDERHGIKIVEWREPENSLLIQSGENSKLLRLGSRISRDPFSEPDKFQAETDEK